MRPPAFTLIELLIVVGLLALVAAFTVPTYQLILSQVQLSTAAADLGDRIRLQEQKTLTEQQIYGVTLTANATSVTLFTCLVADCSSKATSVYALPSNIRISDVSFGGPASVDVRFSTSGAPSLSGYLNLQDTIRQKRRKVEIKPSGSVIYSAPEF